MKLDHSLRQKNPTGPNGERGAELPTLHSTTHLYWMNGAAGRANAGDGVNIKAKAGLIVIIGIIGPEYWACRDYWACGQRGDANGRGFR
jgi:hypothetical protein